MRISLLGAFESLMNAQATIGHPPAMAHHSSSGLHSISYQISSILVSAAPRALTVMRQ